MRKPLLLQFGAALAIGIGLRFVMGLDPVWWLAWILPGLLFALALWAEPRHSRWLVVVAVLIGGSTLFPFLKRVMYLVPAVVITVALALVWALAVGTAQRIVRRFESAWVMLALPVVWTAVDTLLAHFLPDGNWGSVGYSQAEVLPIAQIASVFGLGGIVFLLAWVAGAIGLALNGGLARPGATSAYAATAIAVIAAAGFGMAQLQVRHSVGERVTFGIASIDDFIKQENDPAAADAVWAQYRARVAELAGLGAQVVLLPEKIDVLSSAAAAAREAELGQLARNHSLWLVAGVGVDDGRERHNEAWLFGPDGKRITNYRKHFMAPPEREFVPGNDYPINQINSLRYGLAICKDMHFASLGREFGVRGADVMLVPAWDFVLDARLAAHMTKLRGIESGYTIVRSSREGWLSVFDAQGRTLANAVSAGSPGTVLVTTVEVPTGLDTIYARIGDVLGWASVLATLVLVVWSFRRSRRTKVAEPV